VTRRAKGALPPVAVGVANVHGSCQKLSKEGEAVEFGRGEPSGSPETPLPPASAEQLFSRSSRAPLPPLSPVQRGAALHGSSDSPTEVTAAPAPAHEQSVGVANSEAVQGSEAMKRHGHVIKQMDSVIRKHDERERQVEMARCDEAVAEPALRPSTKSEKAARKAARKSRQSKPQTPNADAIVGSPERQARVSGSGGGATTTAADGNRPARLNSAAGASARSDGVYCEASGDVDQSIRLLEQCKWRVILEHGAMGELVAVAAFAPGANESSTPNTPATPGGCAALFEGQNRSASSYGGGGTGELNLWVNAEAEPRQRSPQHRPLSSMLNGTNANFGPPLMPPRSAWDPNEARLPTTQPPRRIVLPLRRGAPPALWTLLHIYGLREFEAGKQFRVREGANIGLSVLVMVVLVGQIGMAMNHWATVLPLETAIALVVAVLANWLLCMTLVQSSHAHRIFSSTGATMASSVDVRMAGGTYATREQSQLSDDCGQSSPRGVTEEHHLGPEYFASHHSYGAAPVHSRSVTADAPEVIDQPVGMTGRFALDVRRRVRRCAIAILLTTAMLAASDWHWLITLRPRYVAEARLSGSSINDSALRGSDGVLWILGIGETARSLTTGEHAAWGLASTLSVATLSGAFWAPLCFIACVLDAHGHLAGQLRTVIVEESKQPNIWSATSLMSASARLAWLAEQTSERLSLYSAVQLVCLGYAALSSTVHLALNGPSLAPACAALWCTFCIYALLSFYSGSNARYRDNVSVAAATYLQAHAQHDSLTGHSTALMAFEVVHGDLRRRHAMHIYGITISPPIPPLVLAAGISLIAIALQVGHSM